MIRRVGQYLLLAAGLAAFAVLAVMAFMRRDHKVELVVTYHQSSPAEIWQLLTDHASEPQWAAGVRIGGAATGHWRP